MERCFEDAKGELGLSHFEVRNYTSLLRHMILTAVSFLCSARSLDKRRGKNPVLMIGQIRRAWNHACNWLDRTIGIISYHERNILDAATSHAKRQRERLRKAGVAPEITNTSNRKVAL